MKIQQVPTDAVPYIWDRIKGGIDVIGRKCPDYWRTEDVYSYLTQNKATAFLVSDPEGFFVCEKFVEPFKKIPICNVWLMHLRGATGVPDVLMHHMDEIGRAAGCKKLRFVSPRPWEAILDGRFVVTGTIHERNL